MAYIKVDHSRFEKTAQAVDKYVKNHKNNMNKIGSDVNSLSSSWKGNDYSQLLKEWNAINSKNSTSGKMISAMENYADFLRFCGNQYKSAQSRAVNRANNLPK